MVLFRRIRNTLNRGGNPPSARVRPGVLEAQRLLAENPGVDRRDLVDQLVRQRQQAAKRFRGVPESALQPIAQRAAETRARRRRR